LENNNYPIFPSFIFPNIEYFIYLSQFDNIMIEKNETFPKQTLRNRFYIQSANGVIMINIPITKEKLYRQTISEVKICYKNNWNNKALRAICSAYGKSPFFEYYEDDFKEFFSNKYEKLFDLNSDILFYFQKQFKIDTKISITDEYLKIDKDLDFRDVFNTQYNSTKTNKKLNFTPYIQCFSDRFGFNENLSAIDLLFNLGIESINYIKKYN